MTVLAMTAALAIGPRGVPGAHRKSGLYFRMSPLPLITHL